MQLGRSQKVQAGRKIRVGESGFPACLASIASPPKVLFLRGNLPPGPRVAVVGARKADSYGIRVAYNLSKGLAKAGVCVVSGGAAGVDTAAIEGCIAGGGRPVVVQGTGLDIVYPAANRRLFDQVARKGALVSELEPGTPGHAVRFVKRNRIISGLVEGVVVVQAAIKSGSLITAKYAVQQDRLLMAVPGMVDNPLSLGTNQLIRKGALLVEKADDIFSALGIDGSRQTCLDVVREPGKLEQQENTLLEILGSESYPIDVICSRSGIQASRVTALLLEMELRGLVIRKPGMVYCRNQGFDQWLPEAR